MFLGIELGSTRIKGVLIDERGGVIASGSFGWENKLVNGLWSYELQGALDGMRAAYADLKKDYFAKTGEVLRRIDAIGISAMMHGYLAFDKEGELLVPFRTWRNTNTARAAALLSAELDFNMPLRWTTSHYLEAVLDGEEHIDRIASVNTLSGYIHEKLTGVRVLGMDDASGMFPLKDGKYDADRLKKADALFLKHGARVPLSAVLPPVLSAGDDAGYLTDAGALLLDPTGDLLPGVPFCAPEGDGGTGMIATNCVRENGGNVSAGTSAFMMLVMEKSLSRPYPEIDIVTTPDGKEVAMVHVNTCTSEINTWASLFSEVLSLFGKDVDAGELYSKLFLKSLEAGKTVGGLTAYNFLSGEGVFGLEDGMPLLLREKGESMHIADFMAAQLYSAVASLCAGMETLRAEGAKIGEVIGHGGFFKTAEPSARAMSAALGAPISVMETAGEGGAWGMALLALYRVVKEKTGASLPDFLDGVFATSEKKTYAATEEDISRFGSFMTRFNKYLPAVHAAVDAR